MRLTAVDLGGRPDRPLLVLGPSLGTSVATLWGETAALLADDFRIIGWELPGHGGHAPSPDLPASLTIADLAAAVVGLVDELAPDAGAFHYAGVSVAGTVGLQLALDHADRLRSATVLCTAAQIGGAAIWEDRIAQVRTHGTASLVDGSRERWFGPGFIDREPAKADALLADLAAAHDDGYAAVCTALAGFDVRARLAETAVPVLAVAGDQDAVTPPATAVAIAEGVQHGRHQVLAGVSHLAPAEAPVEVARLLRGHARDAERDARTVGEVRAAGMGVRRAVLGDAHVDRAQAATTDFTADFQRFITEYAWGGIWTRDVLDRRARSMITLTALVARGHLDELAMHVRAARTNGLSVEEIGEVILQCAIYCGVPDANAAFRVAQETLAEMGEL